jgi:hypothetical protein
MAVGNIKQTKNNNSYLNFIYNIFWYPINIHKSNEYAFVETCKNDHFELAKWLWNISDNSINLHTDHERAFMNACQNGNINIAKWLWDISNQKINIHIKNKYNDDNVFIICCRMGHFNIVK